MLLKLPILNTFSLTMLVVRQTTMAQMSSQADTNALIAATVHGKGLKPTQPSSMPSSAQPPIIPDQRMTMPSVPPGYFTASYHHLLCNLHYKKT